jgi:hypothetical protein
MTLISSEQVQSAHRALEWAGVRHGDETEVDIAVGLQETQERRPHVAFCSSVMRAGKVLRQGDYEAHAQPISGEIVFDNAAEIASVLQGKTGIAVFRRAKVFTNGAVHIRVKPKDITVVPVSRDQYWDLNSSNGQCLAENALYAVCA